MKFWVRLAMWHVLSSFHPSLLEASGKSFISTCILLSWISEHRQKQKYQMDPPGYELNHATSPWPHRCLHAPKSSPQNGSRVPHFQPIQPKSAHIEGNIFSLVCQRRNLLPLTLCPLLSDRPRGGVSSLKLRKQSNVSLFCRWTWRGAGHGPSGWQIAKGTSGASKTQHIIPFGFLKVVFLNLATHWNHLGRS